MKSSFALSAALLLLAMPAAARWKAEYAQADPALRSWYETRELTKAAQERFHFKSCCSGADKVKSQFRVDRTSGDDRWFWLAGTEWKQVPLDIIHWDEHAPDGLPVLFAVHGDPVCFFPPDGGI